MSESGNGATSTPAPQSVPVDVGVGLMCIDIAGSMLMQISKQMQGIGSRSNALQEIAKVFESLAAHLATQRTEVIRQATSGLVIAGPGDLPPPGRLQ